MCGPRQSSGVPKQGLTPTVHARMPCHLQWHSGGHDSAGSGVEGKASGLFIHSCKMAWGSGHCRGTSRGLKLSWGYAGAACGAGGARRWHHSPGVPAQLRHRALCPAQGAALGFIQSSTQSITRFQHCAGCVCKALGLPAENLGAILACLPAN